MKTLIIMRHGKAEPDSLLAPDHERKLNAQGIQDVPLTAAVLAEEQGLPDHILCSSAARTVQTCSLFTETTGYKGPVTTREHLYMAQASVLLDIIAAEPDTTGTLMLIGHNNGISQLASMLNDSTHIDMSTSAITVITFDIGSWRDLEPGTGKLVAYYTPKPHRN